MIGKFCSLTSSGCFIVLALVVLLGVGGYFYIKEGNGVGKVLGVMDQPVLEGLEEAEQGTLYDKLDSYVNSLDGSKESTLILSEEEVAFLVKDYVSDFGILNWSVQDIAFDFEPDSGRAFLQFPQEFVLTLDVDFEDDHLVVTRTYLGKIKLPQVVQNKITDILYQSQEQLKTNNFGGVLLENVRFMKDSCILQVSKI